MTDPLFGSVSTPLWPSHPFGTTVPGRSVDPNPFGGMLRPLVSGMPLMGPDSAIGVTAPALLTAVALRRGQPLGPTNDQEVEEVIYDAFELLPGTNDVDVRVEGGRAVLSGSVPHKRLKRDLGELAWAIPALE